MQLTPLRQRVTSTRRTFAKSGARPQISCVSSSLPRSFSAVAGAANENTLLFASSLPASARSTTWKSSMYTPTSERMNCLPSVTSLAQNTVVTRQSLCSSHT